MSKGFLEKSRKNQLIEGVLTATCWLSKLNDNAHLCYTKSQKVCFANFALEVQADSLLCKKILYVSESYAFQEKQNHSTIVEVNILSDIFFERN